jgi:hypothetical protein
MRLTILILIAASSIGCGGALGPRPAIAEVPIGTTTTPAAPSSEGAAARDANDDAKSKGGLVAAKIEDSESKKPAPKKNAQRRAPRKNPRR